MSIPVIGITTGTNPEGTEEKRRESYATYAESVAEAGGKVVYLDPKPSIPEATAEDLAGIQGLLLSGGKDVHPDHYAARSEPGDEHLSTKELIGKYHIRHDRERDDYEIPLVQLAYEKRIPILGICRGFQVLNVALGGSLIKDIRTPLRHRAYREGESTEHAADESAMHAVTVDPNSRLFHILWWWPHVVNSTHHQGITVKEMAGGLSASAFAPDGIVEAVESPEHPWALAVQWHPEKRSDAYVHTPCKALFRAFVAAAGSFRQAGISPTPPGNPDTRRRRR